MTETVQRWAIIMRGKSGHAELLPVIHASEAGARSAGTYWQSVSPCNEAAEIVSFAVPLSGAPIESAKDLFTNEGK